MRSHNLPRRSTAVFVTPPTEKVRTKQEFKEEADINVLVRRFGITGQMPQDVRVPMYGDFTGVSDYQSAMDSVIKARDDFMALPAAIRSRFANDPQLLMEFLADKANEDEARKLGLVKPAPEKTRDVVAAVDELAAKLTSVPGAGSGAKP